ncbi:MAG: hypothetical protein AC479_06220 [miscellaneous Crenarchaeota group-6 archaeon AD8-1]|nr:MAG: hypothetical protein AC479_06220 [miscellaneous Crenarchaeota group-6 archaeon AD8-1]
MNITPRPAGVGETVLVSFQLDKTSDTAVGAAGGDHFQGFMIDITRPDGTKETKGPYEAWATSGAILTYAPTSIGTYTFQASFPGQWINASGYERYFKPSTSNPVELIVNEEPTDFGITSPPLPTDSWTRPISSENKGWWQVADNWLMKSYDYNIRHFCMTPAFSPYTAAPDSAHVIWKKDILFGGIAGGVFGDSSYYTGLSYEQFYDPLILEGRIMFVEHPPTASADVFGTRCMDLYTGEDLWYLEGISIDFAQIFLIDNPNEHGLIAHLWDVNGPSSNATATIYDAYTSRHIFTITNITWGRGVSFYCGQPSFGPSGEILSYSLDTANDRLMLWNSSKAIFEAFPWMGGFPGEIYSPRVGAIVDGKLGIQWDVPITVDVDSRMTIELLDVDEGYMLAYVESKLSRTAGFTEYPATATEMAFPTEISEGATSVSPIWTKTRGDIHNRNFYSRNIEDGVYTRWDGALMRLMGYSIQTGEEIWRTEPTSDVGWGYFTYQFMIAYGNLLMAGYDGYLRAFDITDGSLSWEFYFGDVGLETAYNTLPNYSGFNIADGKIYITNDEHSPDSVLWRGSKLWVVDAYTGEEVWSIAGMMRHGAISDGVYTVLNSYDGQVYTFGKGPSKITVEAPLTEVILGEKVIIMGSIMDQSIGQMDTPCVSDDDMSAWMEYLHMNKPIPSDAKGVEITLDVIDANGNYRNIGTATSDLSGKYRLVWEPEIPGDYTIIATFVGSDSYDSSFDEAFIYVEEAPQSTAPPDATPAPMTDMYVMGFGIAILAVVIIIGILLLRKK